jgi:phospholipid transport system substrate-binding protein
MKQTVKFLLGSLVIATLANGLLVQNTMAATANPQDIIEQTTKELFASVKKNNAAVKLSDDYYAEVTTILNKVVDFPFIAHAVMRKSGKGATPEQEQLFAAAFKNGLVKTYAKGIANYADSAIKTLPSTAEVGARRVSIDQDVSDKGTVHRLSYTLLLNKAGEWKLINVVLNGINLGDSFTSQFDQAMIKNGNDIDKVIANWLSGS